MEAETYPVSVSTGTLREEASLFTGPHRWTADGVAVRGAFSGGHLLHVAVGGCVLNDAYREAAGSGLDLLGVRVSVSGGFDTTTWRSLGVDYRVEAVAEIPRALGAGAVVRRVR